MSTKKPLLQICLSRAWGGLEMAAFELARDYTRRGFVVTTVAPRQSKLSEAIRKEGLNLVEVESKKYFAPSATRMIREAVQNTGADSIIMHQLPDIWIVAPALVGIKVRLIGFAHMFLSHSKNDVLHRLLYKNVDKLVCLTNEQKKNFLKYLPISEEQIVIIPNGVDTAKFTSSNRSDEVRRSLGTKDELLIGVVGRLDKLKGQVELVEAAKLLCEKNLRFHLAIIGEDTVGEGGTRAQLEDMIREHKLESVVTLAGFRSNIPEIIASLDVLVMPSWAETFGRVVIEAMASGTPVVATAAGGVPDIINNGEDGLLVPPRNPQALAKALETLLLDSVLRAKFRANGIRKAQNVYEINLVQSKQDEVLILGNANN